MRVDFRGGKSLPAFFLEDLNSPKMMMLVHRRGGKKKRKLNKKEKTILARRTKKRFSRRFFEKVDLNKKETRSRQPVPREEGEDLPFAVAGDFFSSSKLP